MTMTNEAKTMLLELGSPDEKVLNVKHQRLKKRVAELLEERGRRLTARQERLVHVFLLAEGHTCPDDLLDALRVDFPGASMSEVKATMRLLTETGVARSFLVGEELIYEHEHIDEHHDHMICVKCGAIQEFFDDTIEQRQVRVTERKGFRPFFHRLTIHGLCAECFGATTSFRPLSSAKRGERLRIESIDDGRPLILRLAGMGLTRGVEVEVLTNNGSISLLVRGSRLVVGQDMASKVYVVAISKAKEKNK